MSSSEVTSRPLSLHERYTHVRSLLGIPHPITFLITLPSSRSSRSSSSSRSSRSSSSSSSSSSTASISASADHTFLEHDSASNAAADADATPDTQTGDSPLIDLPHLRQRAEYLQSIWPHLYARITDAHTAHPRWTGGPRPWTGHEVVLRRPVPDGVRDAGEMMYWDSKDFRAGPGSGAGLGGPAWRLTLYECNPDAAHEDEVGHESDDTSTSMKPKSELEVSRGHGTERGAREVAYIAFSVNHVLADGTGALRLLSALFSSDQYPAESIPPALESTINIKPGLWYILPQVWQKLIRPRLPAWFQPVEDVDGCLTWPGPVRGRGDGEKRAGDEAAITHDSTSSLQGALSASASASVPVPTPSADPIAPLQIHQGQTTHPERILLLSLPYHTAAALKSLCKTHDLTLHPVLKTAWAWAMFSTISSSPSLAPLKSDGCTPREYTLVGDSPRSERVSGLGHGWATGNYVSGLTYRHEHPRAWAAAGADTEASKGTGAGTGEKASFWAEAASVARHLALSQTITEARQKFGSLAYIPNAPNKVGAPTGWEVFWDEQRSAKEPYGGAVSVSNLGYTTLLSHFVPPTGFQASQALGDTSIGNPIKDSNNGAQATTGYAPNEAQLHWMQPAVPWGDALAVNIIGHAQGLGVTISILDGPAVSERDVRAMSEAFVKILERLGAGDEDYAALVA